MNSAFYFGAHGETSRKAAIIHLAKQYFDEADPKPDVLVLGNRTVRIGSPSDIQRTFTASVQEPTADDLNDEDSNPRRPLSFYIKWTDGRRTTRPTSSYFSCLVDGEGYPSAGILQRHDNYERIASDPTAFVDRFVATCEEVNCFYAVSGFSLLTTAFNSYKSVRNYPIFQRFPGLLYWNNWTAAPHGDRSDDWILDVNWLTAVSDEMLDRIGGYDAARAALGPDVLIHRHACGVVFQAGPKPRIGNAETNDIPDAYREVNRVLMPLRYKGWRSLDHVVAPEPMSDEMATANWIARFD